MPRVTVFSLIYNTGQYVVPALETVRRQTYRDFEHLIIDDCSTDGSFEYVKDWVEREGYPARILRNETNRGITPTLNRIIREARGELVIGVSDDLWDPDFLQNAVAAFDQLSGDYAMVHGDCRLVDAKGGLLHRSFRELVGATDVPPDGYTRLLLQKNVIAAPAAVMRRSALMDIGLYDETLLYEDWDMWLRMSRRFKFHAMPSNSMQYVRRSGAISEKIHTFPFDLTTATFLCKNLGLDDAAADRLIRRHVLRMALRQLTPASNAVRILDVYLAKKSDPLLGVLRSVLAVPGVSGLLKRVLLLRQGLLRLRGLFGVA